MADRQGVKKRRTCVSSDPYWPHQALAGRCTPQSGRRTQIAAERHPRSAACRAFPQTASCLLDVSEEGRRTERERWKRPVSSLRCKTLPLVLLLSILVWCDVPPRLNCIPVCCELLKLKCAVLSP